MQQDNNLESVFMFLFGPLIGRHVSQLAQARPGERVVIIRDEEDLKSGPLPELPVGDFDESPIEDPLPVVDIVDYTSGEALARRLSHGWDVLVVAPGIGTFGMRDDPMAVIQAALPSASAKARAIFMLPAARLAQRHPAKELLTTYGGIRRLIFTLSTPPRAMRSQPSRLALVEWAPHYEGGPAEVIGLARTGDEEARFQTVLDPLLPWTVRALDPAEAEKLQRWADIVGASPLTEVAELLQASREDATASRVIEPRQITPNGIDFSIEPPADDERERERERPSRLIRLAAGDIVGRSLGEPHWSLVTDEIAADGLVAHPQRVLAIRPRAIESSLLLAFLHSDAATRQLVDESATIPRVRTENLRRLRVPTGIQTSGTVVDGVRGFRATSERLANELETRYRTAFDSTDRGQIQESLADAATEAALALELVERATDPLHRARQFLPHPLARTLRAYDNDRDTANSQDVYGDLLRFGETAITIVGIVGLSYMTEVLRQTVNVEWAHALKRGVPLGRWLDCANEAAKAARISKEPLGGLATALSTKSPLNNALESFLTARNNQAHGGGPRSPYEYERERSELEEHLATCVDQLVPLARSEWFVVSSLHWTSQHNTFRVLGRSLRGDRPDFARWETTRAAPLETGVVYVELGALTVPLRGFCQLRSCPTCLNEELYYPDKVTGSMVRLRSLDRGHQAEVSLHEIGLPSELSDTASG